MLRRDTPPLVVDCATSLRYGAGCLDGMSSFYETGTALSAFDHLIRTSAPAEAKAEDAIAA